MEDWTALGVLVTGAGVIVALWSVVSGRREQRDQERRAQAERVSGWFEPQPGPSQYDSVDVTLDNSSGLPVYRVLARVVVVKGSSAETGEHSVAHPKAYSVLPPGRWPQG
jgi:hypothetical protein